MSRWTRRRFLKRFGAVGLSLAGVALATSCGMPAPAGQADKVRRIGYLAAGSREGIRAEMVESFLEGMAELGYADGRNLAIEYRFADTSDQLPAAAAELIELKPELIVASGTPAVFAAAGATKDTPIVMGGIAADPVAGGLAASLARPGGNVTGMSVIARQLGGKRLELLKAIVPGLSRVAVVSNPTNPGHGAFLEDLNAASQALQLELQRLEVRVPDDFEAAFAAAMREQSGALVLLADPLSVNRPKLVAELASKNRMPAVFETRDFVEAGGLMSYAANVLDMYRRSATHVDKILKGASPAELPIEQASKFDFILNVTAAKALGLTIPQSVVLQATEVIE